MLILYSAKACPFAQRTCALLTLLAIEFELREIDLQDRDPEFLSKSPTGKVPLLLDGETVLYESRIINDYLAEKVGWEGAYSSDVADGARQRLAMRQWDEVILPLAYYRPLKRWPLGFPSPAQRESIRRELDQLQITTSGVPSESMLGLHLAPFWARMNWLKPTRYVVSEVRARPELLEWLEATQSLEAVRVTLPEREQTTLRYQRSQRNLILVLLAAAVLGIFLAAAFRG